MNVVRQPLFYSSQEHKLIDVRKWSRLFAEFRLFAYNRRIHLYQLYASCFNNEWKMRKVNRSYWNFTEWDFNAACAIYATADELYSIAFHMYSVHSPTVTPIFFYLTENRLKMWRSSWSAMIENIEIVHYFACAEPSSLFQATMNWSRYILEWNEGWISNTEIFEKCSPSYSVRADFHWKMMCCMRLMETKLLEPILWRNYVVHYHSVHWLIWKKLKSEPIQNHTSN